MATQEKHNDQQRSKTEAEYPEHIASNLKTATVEPETDHPRRQIGRPTDAKKVRPVSQKELK